MQTKGEAAVAKTRDQVEPGTFRHDVLSTAQKFKSSWVELGAQLVKVRDGGLFEEWGFASFEAYCAKELRIKKQTALKLTNSYSFLAKHERGVVRGVERDVADTELPERSLQAVPAFEVISVLAGAEERGQLSEKDYKEIRDEIWSEEKPAAAVARELSQRYPPPKPPEPPADLVVRRLAHAARRLASDLKACKKVPEGVAERAAALAEDVEELAAEQKG